MKGQGQTKEPGVGMVVPKKSMPGLQISRPRVSKTQDSPLLRQAPAVLLLILWANKLRRFCSIVL
jgi:hypothetical protein